MMDIKVHSKILGTEFNFRNKSLTFYPFPQIFGHMVDIVTQVGWVGKKGFEKNSKGMKNEDENLRLREPLTLAH